MLIARRPRQTVILSAPRPESLDQQAESPEEPQPNTDAPNPEHPDYRIERWGEYDNYCCKHCPYSTLHKDVIEQHIRMHRK